MASIHVPSKMRRFFVDKIEKPIAKLYGNENKHLAEVLRSKKGDLIILCPQDKKDYFYEIIDFDKNSTTLKYIEEKENETEPSINLTVYFSLIKGDKSELVVQKLTELGVTKICPFISEYTVQKSDKIDRLKRVALEASKQCGRAIVPEINEVIKFNSMLDMLVNYDAVIFAYEDAFTNGKHKDDILSGTSQALLFLEVT